MKKFTRRVSAALLAVCVWIVVTAAEVAHAADAGTVNVASQVNGGVASASSQYTAAPYNSSSLPPAGANNGDRKGANWNVGGIWHDETADSYPDWLRIDFNEVKSIGEIDVFSVQDNYAEPVDPPAAMTFTQYGLTSFQVQYWTGSAWADVPGGNVTGNNLVWRKLTFSPISTSAIRVLVNASLGSHSRIAEVEAWTATAVVNVASQVNGGVASASSQYNAAPYNSSSLPPAGANNGDRKGANWSTGGIWHDETSDSFPDWLQIDFNGVKSIGEIDVFSVQDNYTAPMEPTPTLTFTQYGLAAFRVEYWTGSDWVDVPGGNVTGNNLVWRKLTFSPISTDRIRVLVNAALGSYSRIAEVEAWTATSGGNAHPNVNLTSPPNSTTLGAPATVNLSADAADTDGTISKVEFYRDATLVQTVTSSTSGTTNSGTWTYSDANVATGSYNYIAKAYDNLNAVTTSTPAATVNVTAASGLLNVALQANGGVASASSQYTSAPYDSTNFPPPAANNGDRQGANWNTGGIWHDATTSTFPDWLQINFNGIYNIGEIDVFSVQDNYASPVELTPTMTFTQYGLSDFQVQYWTGSAWVDVPGGNVMGNNLVWRKFIFSPITTDRIRVLVNTGLGNHSRISEVEAWTAAGQTTYQLTGTLTVNSSPLAAVALSATDNVGCTSTNASGQYSCTVPPGWSGSVTPSLAGYNFTPASRSYNNVTADQPGQDYAATSLTASLQSVASGFSSPLGIEHAGDNRLFVVEQGGQIRILSGGAVLPTPFLDISNLISTGGERGLLGLAFHPSYAANGYFYVNYTRQSDGATIIARYQRSAGDPNVADPGSAVTLLTVAQPFANHNGGQLRFGSDGYLYIGLGDGGSANDPGNRAQDLSTLLGKMLRIDVNVGSPYAIPPGNPFANDGNPSTLPEIWAYGLRNPWRFSFDRSTGDLFIADVGQGAREEINFQPAGTGAGANYGWRVMEGDQCTGQGGGAACFDASFTSPILVYDHGLGCSVTGGYRYRGTADPVFAGYLVYGDFCSGRVWGSTRSASGVWSTAQLLSTGFNISTFGEDAAGEIFVAAYNTGVIYRLVIQ